jgi:hypothetical protein
MKKGTIHFADIRFAGIDTGSNLILIIEENKDAQSKMEIKR